jgi:hypothetical protein
MATLCGYRRRRLSHGLIQFEEFERKSSLPSLHIAARTEQEQATAICSKRGKEGKENDRIDRARAPRRFGAARNPSAAWRAALIKGEDAGSYDELLARICDTLRPSDSLEEIWIRDVVDLVWETFRLRRTKASLLTDSTEWGIGNTLLNERRDAREMARGWAAGSEAAAKDVATALGFVGSSLQAVIARAMSVQLLNMERLDRMLVSAEARRSAALRELDCHRGPLAQKLRRAIADAEHAVLAVDAPRIAAEAQPA